MEQIEILETIIVLLCVVVGALVIGMIAIMMVVSDNRNSIDFIRAKLDDAKKDITELEKTSGKYIENYRLQSIELTRLSLKCFNLDTKVNELQNNKKDKTEEEIILEEIEKNRETLEKNINDRLNK
jgi:hypothetical protein